MLCWCKWFKQKKKLKEINQLQLVFLNLEHFITDLTKFLNPKQNLNLKKLKKIWVGVMTPPIRNITKK